MIQVSESFREELSKPFRTGITNEILLYTNMSPDLVDNPLLEVDSTTGSELDVICDNSPDIFMSTIAAKDFCTFEPNTYDTTNPKRLFRSIATGEEPDEYYKNFNTGIVSKAFYKTAGTSTNPFFTKSIQALDAENYTIPGLTINFGTDSTIFPTKFILEFYDTTGTLLKTLECNDNASTTYAVTAPLTFFKITIKILEMNRKDVKVRISKITFGTAIKFDGEILSTQTKRTGHPISTELPDNSLTVKLWDANNIFDPQNPQGIYYALKGNEKVESYFVYGNERVLVGTYRLDGRPTVENHNVTLNCKSAFWQQIAAYNGGNISGTSELPQEYANRCVYAATGAGGYFSGEFTVARQYGNVSASPQDVILNFANLSLYQFQETPEGKVYVKLLLNRRTDPESEIAEYADGSKAFELASELITDEITLDTEVGTASSFKIAYYLGDSTTASWYKSPSEVTNPDVVIDNPLNRDSDYASQYLIKPRLEWWVLGSHKYTIPYVVDPTIEIGDLIKFTDKYNQVHYGFVSEVNYNYPSSVGSDNIVIYTTDKVQNGG